MSKWRLFSWLKKEDLTEEKEKHPDEITEETKEQEIDTSSKNVQEEEPFAEYTETLYSSTTKRKKTKTKPTTDQRIWRDLNLIEEKIDDLQSSKTKKGLSEIEKRVDRIVTDVQIKKPVISKKSSNIVYVLSQPQAGELKGDWAVERNGEIFSHHKTKDNAIKTARKLAKRKKNGMVMIQNVDGTFDKAFKPKKQKPRKK